MTKEMVNKAKAFAMKHGYSNVEFKLGYIESLPIEDESIDPAQRGDKDLLSGCVAGALLKDDYLQTIKEAGFNWK